MRFYIRQSTREYATKEVILGGVMDIESITNKIINADCMDILKQLPDKCIDLVLTDPPYGGG